MNRLDLPWIRQRLAAHRPAAIDERRAPRRAAVACIMRPTTRGGHDSCELLFIRRALQDGDPWSGHMAFPGGRLEPADASPLDAARRETLEEVGFDLYRAAERIGQLDEIHASARGRVLPLAITPFVFELHQPVEIVTNHEVEETLWVPAVQLLDPKTATTVPYELAGQRFELPGFDVDGGVVWGLTYQMLMRLFAVLQWDVG